MKHSRYVHLPVIIEQENMMRRLSLAGAPLLALLLLSMLFWLFSAAPSSARESELRAPSAPAATLYASADGTGSACSAANPCALQTAVDTAVDGDTVYVAGGNYTATAPDPVVWISKTISLQGGYDEETWAHDPQLHASVLDGDNNTRVVYIDGGDPTLDSFVIQNGYADRGAGLFIASGSRPVLTNNRFENNQARGAGVQYGGAVYDAGGATLTRNQFLENWANRGAAVFVAVSAVAPGLHYNEIYSNTASAFGAVYLEAGGGVPDPLLLEGNVFANNNASAGAGVYAFTSSVLQASSNLFYGNGASSYGGALWSAGQASLWNNTLADNSADTAGGAIYIAGTLEASNNIIAGNSAGSNPGIDVGAGGSVTGGFNNVYANELHDDVTFTSTLTTEPGFANPATGNYHLLGSSANRDAGDPDTPVFVGLDIDGEVRPEGGGVDIGADEFHPGVAAFTLTPDSQTLYGDRGAETVLVHTLANTGTADDSYTFSCTVDLAGWAITACPGTVALAQGEAATVQTRVSIPGSAVPPQEALVELAATSSAGISLTERAQVYLRVAPQPALLFTPNYSETVEAGDLITLTHILTNTGDAADSFALSLSSDNRGWAALLPADPYTTTALLPGSSTQVQVVVHVPQYAPAGLADVIVVTAASAFDRSVTASVEDTVTAKATTGTRYVAPGGTNVDNNCTVPTTTGGAPGPCASVGHATGQASVGDEIRVAQGTYNESAVAINNSLRLTGGWSSNFASQAGPETTVINAGSAARIFTVAPGATVAPSLANLTLTGGYAAGPGGAILVGTGAHLRLERIVFTGNESGGNGGALYAAANSVVTILRSTFRENSAAAAGGALFVDNATLSLQSSRVLTNTAGSDGGALAGQGTVAAFNNLLAGNRASGQGGAWYAAGGAATSGNNTLVDNSAGANGGAFYNAGATLAVDNTLFAGNRASSGGAVYGQSGNSTVAYSLIWNNSDPAFVGLAGQSAIRTGDPLLTGADARLQRGSAAVDTGGPTSLTVDFEGDFRPSDQGYDIGWDELAGCRAQRDGTVYGSIQDALDAGGSPLIRVHGVCRGVHTISAGGRAISQTVHLVNQTVRLQGGWNGDFTSRTFERTIVDPEGRGRAFYVSGAGQPILEHLTIQNGDATGLGGASNGDDAGGAVYNLDSSLVLTNSAILSSTAEVGGAFYNQSGNPLVGSHQPAGSPPRPNDYAHNQAGVAGGAFYNASGGLVLSGLHIYDNASPGNGGAVYNATGPLQLLNTVLEGNQAHSGGALYNAGGAPAVWHNTFYTNTATGSGGALFTQGSTPVVRNNIFLDNQAPAGSALAAGGGAPDLDYNYYYPYGTGTLSSATPGAHSVINNVPPGLEDPAGGDFHLADGAPAVDAGDPASPLLADFEGDIRPSNQGFDIGADELAGCYALVDGVIYGSIQAALQAAPDGATVRVAGRCTGVHTINTSDFGGNAAVCGDAIAVAAHLTRDVTLQGGWNSSFTARTGATLLDARRGGRILYIAPGTTVTVEGFEMRNGLATGSGGAAQGGAVCVDGATATIRENRLHDNEAAGDGGALYAGGASSVLLSSNQILSNTATLGGGAALNASGQSTVQNNFFVANEATSGGAFHNAASANRFWHNTVVGNSAGEDGGALYVATGTPDVRNNIVMGNDAGGAGGGLYAATSVDLSYNDFTQNTAAMAGSDNFGGEVSSGGPGALSVDPQFVSRAGLDYLLAFSSPVVDRGDGTVPLLADFEGDIRPSHQGSDMGADEVGGCYARIAGDPSATIYGSLQQAVDIAAGGATVQFSGACQGVNSRSVDGTDSLQGLFLDKSLTIDGQWSYAGQGPGEILPLGRGRGLTVASSGDGLLSHVTIRGGDAASAGYAAGDGGAVYNAGNLRLENGSQLAGSSATNGAAIYNTGTVEIAGSSLLDNNASLGGALYNQGMASVDSSRLYGNNATSGGGAIYQAAGTLWLDGNRLYDNSAASGGALFLDAASDLRIWNNFIYRNDATAGGGITYDAGSAGAILHNTLVANSASGGQGGGLFVAGGTVDVDNNIVDRNTGSGIHVASGAGATLDYNNVTGNSPSNYSGLAVAGAHSITQTPLYVAMAVDDYHLQATSPGLDAGVSTAVARDIDGDIRPTNRAPDMGADELALCLIRVGGQLFGVLQEAIDYAEANNLSLLEVARGECRGVQQRNGTWQVGYVSGGLEIVGSLLPGTFADPDDYNNPSVGANSTVFNAEGAGRVLYVAPGATLTVSHVIFANGNSAAAGGLDSGGAIYDAGTLTLEEANICQSTAGNGGGIFVASGARNSLYGGYTGECLAADFYSGAPLWNYRTYAGNTAATGGGHYIADGATLDVRNHGWVGNSASADGGALYNASDPARLVNGVFYGNSSTTGNGGAVANQGTLHLYHNTFNSNQAPAGSGGAIHSPGSLTLNSTIIYNNSAASVGGVDATAPTQAYNLFFANSPLDASFPLPPDTLQQDPLLHALFTLDVDSPAIDRADPANWQTGVPPDGLKIDFEANNELRPDGNSYGPYPPEAPSVYNSDIGADEWAKDFGCRVSFSPPGRTVQAGDTVTYTVSITNTGRQVGSVWHFYTDTLTVTLANSSQGWAELEGGPQQTFTLGGREAVQRVVTVTVPAEATTAQQEVTAVRCTSLSYPGATSTGSATTRVGLDSGVLVEPDYDASARPGEVLTFTHRVTNSGNQTDDFALRANSGPRHATAALVTEAGDIYTPTVTLAPGETYTVLLRVRVLETATATDTAQPGVVARSTSDPLLQGAALNTIVIAYTSGTRYVAGAGALDDTNCTDPQNPCATISHAIAQATAGDTILVAAGSYEPIVVDKSVTIRGGYSTVDGFGAAQPVTRAVTLTGSEQPLVSIRSGVTATLSSLFIQGGSEAGIANSGALTISGTWILDNAGSGLVHGGPALTVLNSVFAGNGGEGDGGAIAAAGGEVTLLHNSFAGNSATGNGGALYQAAGNLALYNNLFSANSAAQGSAVYLEPDVSVANDYNLYHEQTEVNLTRGPNAVTGNPLLAGPTYHLGAGSAAIDRAGATWGTDVDFELERRPQGIAFDIGADEYTQRAEFVFLPESQTALVEPGGTTTFYHTITNTGDFIDTYSLAVASFAEPSSTGWTVVITPAAAVSVPAGDSRQLAVTVGAPAAPGYRHTTIITATSLAAGSATVQDLAIVSFEAGVAIGPSRSGSGLPGSAITYTHTITNLGNGYDTFALSVVESRPPAWEVTLSPSNIALAAGASASFAVAVQIPAGAALDGVHTALIAAHSTADPAVSDVLTDTTTASMAPPPEYGLLLLPASLELAVLPGAPAVYTHMLTNTGNVTDTVTLTVSTDLPWSDTVTPEQITLAAGESVPVRVEIATPADAAGLTATTTITAVSTGDSSVTAQAVDVTAITAPAGEYGVALSPGTNREGLAGETVTFVHTITNTGSVADSFVVTALSDPQWPLSWPANPLALGPGASAAASIALTIPVGTAPPARALVTVSVQSQGDPAVTAGAVDRLTVMAAPQTEWLLYLPVVAQTAAGAPPPTPTPTPTVGPSPTPTATPSPTVTPTPCTPTGIDLVVTGITVQPATPSAGEEAVVYVTIENQGSRDVPLGNNFYLDFYVDREPGYLLPGDLVWGVQGSWMEAGASRTFAAGYLFGAGSHRLYALVDTDNSVDECPYEGNNRFGPVPLGVTTSALSPGEPNDGPEATPAPTMAAPRSTPTPQPPEQEEPRG